MFPLVGRDCRQGAHPAHPAQLGTHSTMTNTLTPRFEATDEEVNEKRENLLCGIAMRADWERAHVPLKGKKAEGHILETLLKHAKKARDLDAFTLSFAVRNGICFVEQYNHQRVDGALMNEKAIPKTWECMRVLNGSAFAFSSEGNTTAATCLALEAQARGGNPMFAVDVFVNDVMQRWGHTNYHNGSTQSCSSLRAMVALGVVRKEGKGHVVSHDEHFRYMLKAAKTHDKARMKGR